MKLIDKLSKISNKAIKELYTGIFGKKAVGSKEELISHIVKYYCDYNNYPYLFSDSELAYFESVFPCSMKRKIFSCEISDLKERFFIYYDRELKDDVLYEEMVEPYHQYLEIYTKEEREQFGLFRYLTIAFVYAYGAIKEDEFEILFENVFENFNLNELFATIKASNYYQGKILQLDIEGENYYCINDENFAHMAIGLRDKSFIQDFAAFEEDTLLAYYYDGYDSTNTALFELKELLNMDKKEEQEFYQLIIYTYALLQSKVEILDFILFKLRYQDVSNQYIIRAFELVEDAYHSYGSYITKGFSPEKVDRIIEDNIELMKEHMQQSEFMNELEETEDGVIN